LLSAAVPKSLTRRRLASVEASSPAHKVISEIPPEVTKDEEELSMFNFLHEVVIFYRILCNATSRYAVKASKIFIATLRCNTLS